MFSRLFSTEGGKGSNDIHSLLEKLRKERVKLKVQSLEFEKKVQSLEFEKKVLSFEYEKKVQSLQSENEKKVQSLESVHEKKVQSLQSENEKKVQSLQSENEKKVQSLQSENEKKVQSLESVHEKKVQSLQSENEKKVQSLESENEKKVQSLQSENEKKVQSLESVHEKKVQSLESVHEKKVKSLESENAELKSKFQKAGLTLACLAIRTNLEKIEYEFKCDNRHYSSLSRGQLYQAMFLHEPEKLKPFLECIAKYGKLEIKKHFKNDLKPISGVVKNDPIHTVASYLTGYYHRLSRHVHNVNLERDEITDLLDLVPTKFFPIDKCMAAQISNMRADMHISLLPIPAPSDPPAFDTRSEFEIRLLEELYEEDYQYGVTNGANFRQMLGYPKEDNNVHEKEEDMTESQDKEEERRTENQDLQVKTAVEC